MYREYTFDNMITHVQIASRVFYQVTPIIEMLKYRPVDETWNLAAVFSPICTENRWISMSCQPVIVFFSWLASKSSIKFSWYSWDIWGYVWWLHPHSTALLCGMIVTAIHMMMSWHKKHLMHYWVESSAHFNCWIPSKGQHNRILNIFYS